MVETQAVCLSVEQVRESRWADTVGKYKIPALEILAEGVVGLLRTRRN